MATPMEHYREAEQLKAQATEWAGNASEASVIRLLMQAQVSATLATMPDSQYRPEGRKA